MKIVVIGSNFCPDTREALEVLRENNVEVDFYNISANLDALKEYLALRDNSELYTPVKQIGGIGIPCFILEDGTKTMEIKDVVPVLSK